MKNFFSRIGDFFSNFMNGRNGMDDIAKFSLLGGVIIYFLSTLTGNSILYILSWIAIFYSVFRSFSRNIDSRRKENTRFLVFFEVIKLNFQDRKSSSRIYMCSSCCKKIRVPKGKGKIEITCPNCGNKMIHRT
ncbi:MAG: hypothetical protein LUG62_04135 [Clostridiales bacterium]|nr:hypothetical protein [Clostridiales bacterium]